MFPLSADKLSFLEIADYWSRKSPASKDELLALLEAAWWRGQIAGNSAYTRLQFLRIMYLKRHDLQCIVFVTPNDACPPTETPLPDGEVVVDLTPRIPVPGEMDEWTEDSCNDAFEKLAVLPSQQYFPLLSYSICFIELTPEEFFGWVTRKGFATPTFWKRTAETEAKQISPQDSDTWTNSPLAVGSARGAMRRAIQRAFSDRFPDGKLPIGMTSKKQIALICDRLKKMGVDPCPHTRTIEKAIKPLKR
jgi:hypothetical protein